MSILFSKTCGLPVISATSSNRLGEVIDLVIDPGNGKLLALLVGEGVLAGKRIVKIDQINNFSRNTIIVRNDQALEYLERTERIREIVSQGIKIMGNKVITQSGKNLGKVEDFEVDLTANKLSSIYVRGGLIKNIAKGPLIIPSSQIVSIAKDAIVVKDETVKIKEKVVKEPELAGASV